MSFNLDFSLTVLVWVLVAFFAVLGFLISKCLVEFLAVMKNCNAISEMYKEEAAPVIKELKETLSNINKLTSSATQSANTVKNVLFGTIGAGSLLFSGLRKCSGGFMKGLISGFNMFRK